MLNCPRIDSLRLFFNRKAYIIITNSVVLFLTATFGDHFDFIIYLRHISRIGVVTK